MTNLNNHRAKLISWLLLRNLVSLATLLFSFMATTAYAGNSLAGCSDYSSCLSLAKQGKVEAQLRVAEMYETGSGVKKDLIQAFAWYETSNKGNINSDAVVKKISLYSNLNAEGRTEADRLSLKYNELYNKRIETSVRQWGGHYHKVPDLIGDFVSTAFSRYIWPEVTSFHEDSYGNIWSFFEKDKKDGVIKLFPWIEELVMRKEGRPKFDALNRWNQNIRIGFGWPVINEKKNKSHKNDHKVQVYNEELGPHIISIAKQLEKTIDLDIEFVPVGAEVQAIPANIRIVLDARKPPKSKDTSKTALYLPIYEEGDIRRLFTDAVLFTPSSKKRVDGFYVSNKDNEIKFGACLISSKQPTSTIRSQISECLIRILGMPELSKNEGASILNNSIESELIAPTEYDLGLLHILYCKKLLPGMSRYSTISTLFKSNECFKSRE